MRIMSKWSGSALGELGEAADDAGVAADLAQRDPGHHQPAEHEQRHLDDIGQRDRLQPAVELIEQGERAERRPAPTS